MAFAIHSEAANEEALTWGAFRNGFVTISGTTYRPPKADLLPAVWEEMVAASASISDHYSRAIFIFLEMARTQFFFDVNKRTGRFMMSCLDPAIVDIMCE